MKKIIITVILAIGFVTAVAAQPKAIGGRLGWGLDLSYEHNVGSKANFIESPCSFCRPFRLSNHEIVCRAELKSGKTIESE